MVKIIEKQEAVVLRENEELTQLLTMLDRDVFEFLGCPWGILTEFSCSGKRGINLGSGYQWINRWFLRAQGKGGGGESVRVVLSPENYPA